MLTELTNEYRIYQEARSWFCRRKFSATIKALYQLKIKLISLLGLANFEDEKDGIQDLIYDVEIEIEERELRNEYLESYRDKAEKRIKKNLKPNPNIIILLTDYKTGNLKRELERELILMCLDYFDGNRQDTADALGISYKCLYVLLKKYREGDIKKGKYKPRKYKKCGSVDQFFNKRKGAIRSPRYPTKDRE